MKKILLTILIINLSLAITKAQSGWFWQNPLPFGNTTNDIYFFDSQTGLLTLSNGKILKSTNAGNNWNDLSEVLGFSFFDMNFFDNLNGIAFSGSIYYPPLYIFRTNNGGNSWSNYSLYPFSLRKNFQAVSSSVFYANSDYDFANIVKSTNGGLNWSTVFADSNFYLHYFHFPSASIGFATGIQIVDTGIVNEVIKSTDGGSNWVNIHQNFSGIPQSIYFIDNNNGFVDVLPPQSGGNELLYKTTNGGSSWLSIALIYTNNRELYFINENTGYIGTSYFTTNGGLNWNQMPNYFDFAGMGKIRVIGANVFGVGYGVIAKSTNSGFNWTELTSGPHTFLWDIKFINSLTGLAVGDYGKIIKTTNGGTNWILNQLSFSAGENWPIAISMPSSNNWFVADNGDFLGKIFKTSNAGLSWDTTYTYRGGLTKVDFVNALTGFAICKYNYFMKTTDGGNNWSDTNLHISQNWALDFVDANTGLIGSYMGTYRTTNGGTTWSSVGSGPPGYSTAIQFVNASTVYACKGGLYKSTNAGLNWIQLMIPGASGEIRNICFINPDSGYVTCNSIFRTTNGGTSFVEVSPEVYANTYFFTDMQTGYGAGWSGGILKTTTGGEPIGIQPISNEVPNNFVLHQNYPNPFNPVTKIKFSIPASLSFGEGPRVRLIIYDITGREVATLLNEQLSPGTYEVNWDGTNYASGVYFYQLQAGDFIQTKKMVLIK